MGDSGAGQGQPRDNQRGESLAFLAATAFLTAPPSPRPCLFTGRPGASSHLRAAGDAVPEGRTLSRGPSYSRRFGHFPKPASRFRLCRLLRTVYKCHLCFILILDSLSLYHCPSHSPHRQNGIPSANTRLAAIRPLLFILIPK